MLRNYLKIALRNLQRRKFYAFVTLLSLTLGITFLLLIGNYIRGELAVNKTLRNVDRQYVVQSEWKVDEMGCEICSLAPAGPTLKQAYPNLVANYYRHYDVTAIVSAQQNHFRERIQVGDSTLLPMFGFPLLYGDPATALRDPNSVVLTQESALTFFGRTDVLRQSLTIQTPMGGKQRFTVTGVLRPLPDNVVTNLGTFTADMIIPMRNIGYFTDQTQMQSWDNRTIVTHLELQPNVVPDQLAKPVARMLATHTSPDIQSNLHLTLSPLTTYHLTADNGLAGKMILTLSLIGVFILLMAVVNFVNITIGMSATRLREIGVRKALGGLNRQLVGQFLTEAFLLTIGATMLALVLHEAGRSAFGNLLDRPIVSLVAWPPVAWLGLVGLVVLIGLLAGSYPAFVLSNRPSVEALKGKLTALANRGIGLRRTLIGFQFIVAIFVFVNALVIGRQVTYFFNKNLGYQKEQLLTVASVPRDWSRVGVQRMEGIRNQLMRVPGVRAVSVSFEIPDGSSSGSVSLFAEGRDSTTAIVANSVTTDEQFAQTYRLRVKAGHFFTNAAGTFDSTAIVLNESAVKSLGWAQPERAINQYVRFWGTKFRISGVLADFHFGSLHEPIKPLVFVPVQTNPIYRYFSFNLAAGNLPETVAALNNEWSRLLPDTPFEYAFMDDTVQKLYAGELQLQKASRLATVLALVIVLLGVLGLVSLNVTRRTKEIGIRKTLGASTVGIVNLFLKEFVLILLVANVIAGPIAWYFLQNWLSRFAYRLDLSGWPFVAVAATLALLTGLIISAQTIRAALANPVQALRSE